MTPDIKIRTLTGSGIKTYIPSIAKVREQIRGEFPYLRLAGLEADLGYLKHLSQYKDAIAVLVFDGPTIVGASTGMPLCEERPEVQEPFIKQGLPIEEYYYFDLSALLKPYRSRGIAHHFFDLREEHVLHLKRFTKICFTSVSPQSETNCPTEQMNLESFWKKRGYVEHLAITGSYCAINPPCAVTLKFWVKDLHNVPVSHPMNLNKLGLLAFD